MSGFFPRSDPGSWDEAPAYEAVRDGLVPDAVQLTATTQTQANHLDQRRAWSETTSPTTGHVGYARGAAAIASALIAGVGLGFVYARRARFGVDRQALPDAEIGGADYHAVE